MREIKFRAWNGQKMITPAAINENGWYETDRDFEDGRYSTSKFDGLMQFTGLKDKNGKEIYEGDIVNQEKWVSVGEYVKTIGLVTFKGVGFTCECKKHWEGSNADLNGNAEIIGNIYEHPDLLK